MNRPFQTWILFGLSVVVLLIALGKVTIAALALDDARRHALDEATVEERIRESVTRLDRSLLELLARESAWSPDDFVAFRTTRNAFVSRDGNPVSEEVRLASPLLAVPDPVIALRFEYGQGVPLRSPQVPEPALFNVAVGMGMELQSIDSAGVRLDRLRTILETPWTPLETNLVGRPQHPDPTPAVLPTQFDRVAAAAATRSALTSSRPVRPGLPTPLRSNLVAKLPSIVPGAFVGIRVAGELLLVREVAMREGTRVQGCWLDWPELQQRLLQQVVDLLPQAELHLDEPGEEPEGGHRIAVLDGVSLDLVPGPLDLPAWTRWTPVRVTLALAWVAVLCAALAVGLLLNGAVSLSERRAAFVSAVTHELRTPLTTFKMYSEMLAEDMVPDATRRKSYLTTLCSEANRLGHLVENVLAYAQLERGSARRRVERVSLGEPIERVKPRLEQRAGQVEMKVVVDSDGAALATVVHVDVSAVEQILFNLVDNACKYAAPTATEKSIHLEALPDGNCALLRVRDHGQGISAEGAKRLFQPFSKSAHEAAHSAPGVGLGLALCRRLSRSMGGDLRLDALVKNGACFVLTLPLGQAEAR